MKDVTLYRFDDGWEVRRILTLPERKRLTGRDLWPEDRSLFGLYDATGAPRSSVDVETSPPFLDAGLSILTPEGMKAPTDGSVEKYWITFISECIDEDMVQQLVRSIIAYPDELLERLKMPEVDAQIFEAVARLEGKTQLPDLYKRLDQIEAIARAGAERAFDGLEGFKVLPPRHPRQKPYATIHVLANDHVLLISAAEGGWTMRSGNNAMPSIKMYDQPNLTQLWNWYVEVVGDREHIDLLPQSQADAWWDEHTLPGHSLYDLEPYELLGVDSPYVFSDEAFWTWYLAQEGAR